MIHHLYSQLVAHGSKNPSRNSQRKDQKPFHEILSSFVAFPRLAEYTRKGAGNVDQDERKYCETRCKVRVARQILVSRSRSRHSRICDNQPRAGILIQALSRVQPHPLCTGAPNRVTMVEWAKNCCA